MDGKVIKLKTHPRNFCEEELIVNLDVLSKEKLHLEPGDIIGFSIPPTDENESTSSLYLQVERLSQDIQSNGGPLSISKELAQMFKLEGVREVSVRRVDREEVGLDLVELRFKDQCLTRSDMWRFSCSLIGKCVYLTKKVDFAGIRCQVSRLWSEGEEVQSGAIVTNTRVVYRSASAHFFIFIQISSEMWEFDSSGDLYFDKAEGGFLKELFKRWKDEQCSHEVTLIFFWRIFYSKEALYHLPPYNAVRKDKRGYHYEDFYKVIAQEEMMTDWSSRLVEIKTHFLHLKDLLAQTRGKDAVVSPACEGNILEAINLAVNIYEKNYQNCNFQLTGQQIVIVTPGVGVFEVERDLTLMTKERIIDTGVGVDLVSLTEQPLHAVPLFKFHSSSSLDSPEFYNLPHWINYSFYNPLHPWDSFRFRPILTLSDHLINSHLRCEDFQQQQQQKNGGGGSRRLYQPHRDVTGLSPHTHSSWITLRKNRNLFRQAGTNHEEHDAAIFLSGGHEAGLGRPIGKVRSAGKLNLSQEEAGKKRVRHPSLNQSFSQSPNQSSEVAFKIAFSPVDKEGEEGEEDENDDAFEAEAADSPSAHQPALPTKTVPSLKDSSFVTSLKPVRARVFSESVDPLPISASISSHTLCPMGANSAESLPKYARLAAESRGKLEKDAQILVTTKRTKFINPFDPTKVHGELTAFHRRWIHTFPRDKSGLAFQTHHSLLSCEGEEGGGRDLDSVSTLSPTGGHLSIGGRSWSDHGQEFRTLQQVGGRSQGASVSSSFEETLVGSGDRGGSLGSKGDSAKVGVDDTSKFDSKDSPLQDSKLDSKSDGGPRSHKSSRSKATPPRGMPALPWRKMIGHRHMSDSSTKAVEDFTSIRRTGVDWKSLTEPACLPVSVDFFPSKEKLEMDYYESPSNLVVSSCESQSEVFSSMQSRSPRPWIANHQKVDTFEAFREMISQRLSQGFQLVFDSKARSDHTSSSGSWWSGQSNLASISALHEVLSDQKQALAQKAKLGKAAFPGGSVTVKLSLGKVFQKLELAYPDIYIYIYKQKVIYHPHPFEYSYQLCGVGSDPGHTPLDSEELPFAKQDTKFKYYRAEEYNWNYLDQHVLGFSEFEELQESHKYWRCRYLLLPSSPPPDIQVPLMGRLGAEERERLASRDASLIASFARFIEFLNHIKRIQPAPPAGKACGLRRNNSLPASHSSLYGIPTPSISRCNSITPNEIHSLISSPITIQSPYLPKGPKKLPDIGESLLEARSKLTPNEFASDAHDKALLESQLQATPLSGEKKHGMRDRRGAKVIRGSPQHLKRRMSREELVSPNPESRGDVLSFGRVGDIGSYMSTPTSSRTGSSGNESRYGRGREGTPQKSDKSPEIVVDDVSGSSLSTSSFDVSIQLLNETSPPQIILKAMESQDEGIDFLNHHPGLGDNCCFIAMEAVTWLLDKVSGLTTRGDAIKILQEMKEDNLIVHASGDLTVSFHDGFFIYGVCHRMNQALQRRKETKDDPDHFLLVSPEYEAFSKQWFEVGIQYPGVDSEVSPLNMDYSPSPSPYTGMAYSSYTKSPYDYTRLYGGRTLQSSRTNSCVELNPDPQFRSDRPEWCFVHYDRIYHPRRCFQFELQWMVCTVTLFNQLIQNWVHKAGMCGFNLVPVPVLQNLCKEGCRPFGSRQYIPLHLPPSVCGSTSNLGELVGTVMNAIIAKLGFILDPASAQEDLLDYNVTLPITSRFYVHFTGCALIRPTCAESLMKLMDKQRRFRTSSHGTTMGRGDYAGDMGQDYTEDLLANGGKAGTFDGWGSLLMSRQGSSTPLNSLDLKSGWAESVGKRRGSATPPPLQCGFYWYKNTCLSRHKVATPHVLAECGSVREQLVALCSNRDGQLTQLCDRMLGIEEEEAMEM